MSNSANQQWMYTVEQLLNYGSVRIPRQMETMEILNHSTKVAMDYPIVTYLERGLGHKFMTAEALWILTGKNTVKDIVQYSKVISKFSDDGYYFHGAYGPKLVDQFTYIVDELIRDRDTRQAVANIWRENPRVSKDIPCTISSQWMIRDDELHCFDTMRSSDIWLGWPYDIFNFTMISGFLALQYKQRTGEELLLGNIYLTAASQHLYAINKEQAIKCVWDRKSLDYNAFDISAFDTPDDLLDWLNDKTIKGDIIGDIPCPRCVV